jgi:hypothetical protein
VATNQGPGLPVVELNRSDRVHLSKRIDLMAEVLAIGFEAPALDPHNAETNVVGGEGHDVSNAAVVGIRAARAAESKGEGISGMPLLELHVTGAVESEGVVEGNRALQKQLRMDDYSMSPSRGEVYQSK